MTFFCLAVFPLELASSQLTYIVDRFINSFFIIDTLEETTLGHETVSGISDVPL